MFTSATAHFDRDDVDVSVHRLSNDPTATPYAIIRLGDSRNGAILFPNDKDALSALIEQASDALTAWIDA